MYGHDGFAHFFEAHDFSIWHILLDERSLCSTRHHSEGNIGGVILCPCRLRFFALGANNAIRHLPDGSRHGQSLFALFSCGHAWENIKTTGLQVENNALPCHFTPFQFEFFTHGFAEIRCHLPADPRAVASIFKFTSHVKRCRWIISHAAAHNFTGTFDLVPYRFSHCWRTHCDTRTSQKRSCNHLHHILFPSSALLWRALNCPATPCLFLIIYDKRKIVMGY
ncbi:hypothetical protein D3C80_1304990 [compost metagenome]